MNSDGLEPGVQFVDVKKVFHEKNPRLAPLIPGFVYRFIKNLVHEDYINEFLRKHGHKQGLEFIEAVIADFNVTTEIIGEENLTTGRESSYLPEMTSARLDLTEWF